MEVHALLPLYSQTNLFFLILSICEFFPDAFPLDHFLLCSKHELPPSFFSSPYQVIQFLFHIDLDVLKFIFSKPVFLLHSFLLHISFLSYHFLIHIDLHVFRFILTLTNIPFSTFSKLKLPTSVFSSPYQVKKFLVHIDFHLFKFISTQTNIPFPLF